MTKDIKHPETIALHGGEYRSDPATTAVAVPIYRTTSYQFKDTDTAANLFALKEFGNIYTRIMNPTCDALEKRVAAFEGGLAALAVSSGQSASAFSILNVAQSGDNFISSTDLYGGTVNLFTHTLKKQGIEVKYADPLDPKNFEKLIDDKTRAIYAETLPNPYLRPFPIKEVSDTKDRNTAIFSQRVAEEKLLRKMSAPPEVLHIATHGFFLKEDEKLKKRLKGLSRGSSSVPPPADNPLLRAGLAFAGLNANASMLGEIDTDNDGVLTAMEVLSLDLAGTQLVVLSACETGLGEIHEGEGVYGLRRSFQEAGVKNVIKSFWEVSDAERNY